MRRRQFRAQYFDNIELLGDPILTECHDQVDVDWGLGRAHPRVPEDQFAVRWTGQIDFMAGTYRIQASSDDGTRVYLDGEVVIDAWRPRPVRTSIAHGHVEAGRHDVVVEYFDRGGHAVARLQWERSTTGWFEWHEDLPMSLSAAEADRTSEVVAPPP